jgi:hypothetical protein
MSSLNNSIIPMHVHRPSTAAAFMALTTYKITSPQTSLFSAMGAG